MTAKAIVLGSCALFALTVTAAQAGPCSTEIDNLSKTLASKDAGSGPTPGAAGSTSSSMAPGGQHPPTTAMSQAAQGSATSPEDVRRQTAGQPTAAQQAGSQQPGSSGQAQHPPTAAMSQAAGGQGAGVSGQHPPTAATGQATQSQAARGENVGSTGASPADASAALAQARMLDQQGKEAECMQAVQQAKQAGAR